MTASTPPQAGRTVAVALFENPASARQAADALRGVPFGILSPDTGSPGSGSDVSALLATANQAGDIGGVLTTMGVPDGEARFYSTEVQAGRALVVAQASNNYDDVRDLLLRHGGYDVQSRGGELARNTNAGVAGGTGPAPIDLTERWEDVASRYEMLFGQHFGTGDANWDDVQPVYAWAWERANDPAYRGRPWAEVEADMRGQSPFGEDAMPMVRDVWQDVAEEAAQGAEGGRDRRIPRQGADQEASARDLA